MKSPLDHRAALLLRTEIREYFLHRRSLHLLPLLAFGVFGVAWIYPVGSPIAPVIIVVIAALESQFNNIFYRSRNELEGMSLFPVPWRKIILVKNVGTIVLVAALLVLLSMALLYFSPDRMTPERWGECWMYISTIVFPLLTIGNAQSVQRPRRVTGLQVRDLVEALWLMVNLALLSIPYYLFTHVLHLGILCPAYSVLAAWYWYRHSVNGTALKIEKEIPTICSRR